MKILITGATGFVGLNILYCLENSGHEIFPVVREGNEYKVSHFKNVRKIIITKNLFKEDVDWWLNNLSSIDIVIHAAWFAKPGQYLNHILNIECLAGSLTLLDAIIQSNVKKVVGIGTCFEYDLKREIITTDSPLLPVSPYASAKTAVYLNYKSILELTKIKFAWCRLFYLFGAGEDENRLVPYVRNQLKNGLVVNLTSGNQIRDYIDVAEAAHRITKVALGEFDGPYNICSGKGISVRDFVCNIAKEFNRVDLLHFGVRKENIFDPPFIVGVPNII